MMMAQCYAYHPTCFLYFFYIPYISLFNSKNFSFTCNIIRKPDISRWRWVLRACTCTMPGIARTSARETHAAETTKVSLPVSGLPGVRWRSADPFDPPWLRACNFIRVPSAPARVMTYEPLSLAAHVGLGCEDNNARLFQYITGA